MGPKGSSQTTARPIACTPSPVHLLADWQWLLAWHGMAWRGVGWRGGDDEGVACECGCGFVRECGNGFHFRCWSLVVRWALTADTRPVHLFLPPACQLTSACQPGLTTARPPPAGLAAPPVVLARCARVFQSRRRAFAGHPRLWTLSTLEARVAERMHTLARCGQRRPATADADSRRRATVALWPTERAGLRIVVNQQLPPLRRSHSLGLPAMSGERARRRNRRGRRRRARSRSPERPSWTIVAAGGRERATLVRVVSPIMALVRAYRS